MSFIRRSLGYFSILILFLLAPAAHAAILEVSGKNLAELAGKNPEQVRVYAADSAGRMRAIPFQVEDAAPAFAATSKVLAMAGDFGPRVDPGKWPAAPIRYEIAADNTGTRVAYLTWEDTPSALSPRSYLKYDAAIDQVDSDGYQLGFSKSAPIIQDRLVIKTAANPQDILDRFKVRLKLKIKNFFDFKIDESEINSQILIIEAGPIRIHRAVVASKKIGPIKVMPKSRIDFYFYPSWVEVVSQIINPVDGPKILEDTTSGASGYDLNAAVKGSAFRSSSGASLQLNGTPTPAEAELSNGKITWWSLAGAGGSMIVQVKNDPKLASQNIEPNFILQDDLSRADKPESEVGGIFLGFNLPYHRLPKGEYSVRVTQVFPGNLTAGGEVAALADAKVQAPSEVRKLP